MFTVPVKIRAGYTVQIAAQVLARVADFLPPELAPHPATAAPTAVLVSDATVFELYGAAVEHSLRGAAFTVEKFIFPAGENAKTLATYAALVDFLAAKQVTKTDVLVALGGGVVGDLGGFAAATFLRGMKFIQLPTTLLAMVDAAVGGKTAVNLTAGKNLLGAFYQPQLVLADVATLATLAPPVFADGVAEMIKYALLGDPALFATLAAGELKSCLAASIARCVEMKRDLVVADERDEGARQLLNLGHTFGHALEKASGFTLTHGAAVACGMSLMAHGAAKQGFAAPEVSARLDAVLRRYALPTAADWRSAGNSTPEKILAATLSDKKRRGGRITLVVPREIGRCELRSVATEELATWFAAGTA
jgi:3-dehydroquinate synthase